MTKEVVGLKLVDNTGVVVESYGGPGTSSYVFPNPLILPSKNTAVHAAKVDEFYKDDDGKEYKLIWWEEDVVVSKEQVNIERDRRIYLPKTVTLPNAGTIRVDMAGDGRENVGDLGTAALAKISIGDNSTIPFRDADNIDRNLTNQDIVAMGLQIMQQVSIIHVKARAIKAMEPIPNDFTDEKYW